MPNEGTGILDSRLRGNDNGHKDFELYPAVNREIGSGSRSAQADA